jgi:hypothetical protein
MKTMSRNQIRSTEEEARRLREGDADRPAQREAAILLAGRYQSGLGDLARGHDHYLAQDLRR